MSYTELKDGCYRLMDDVSAILSTMEGFRDEKDLDEDDEDPASEAYLDIIEYLDMLYDDTKGLIHQIEKVDEVLEETLDLIPADWPKPKRTKK